VLNRITGGSWTPPLADASLLMRKIAPTAMANLLAIQDLHVRFLRQDSGTLYALNGVNLHLREGEVLGILGESGSGKSTLAKSLLRLLPKTARVEGEIDFRGQKISQLTEREMNQIRGAWISRVPQEPKLALNPVMRIGDQVAEVLHAHRNWSWQRCRTEAECALERVGLFESARRFYNAYPHQLSGGQQQRAVIAQAVACVPALLIADEPTASLDSTTEVQILELFRDLKTRQNTSLLFITHNPELLRDFADRVAVLYAGRVIETRSGSEIFERAWHPYLQGLLACSPAGAAKSSPGPRFRTIAGLPPDPQNPAKGCSFAPRCSDRMARCEEARPELLEVNAEEGVECFLYER